MLGRIWGFVKRALTFWRKGNTRYEFHFHQDGDVHITIEQKE